MAWLKALMQFIDRLMGKLYPTPVSEDNDPIVPIIVAPPPPKRLTLAYEAQPWKITQPWGVPYNLFGVKRHHGLDVAHGHNARIRAPFDCVILGTQYQSGGGRVLSILSAQEWLVGDDLCFVRLDYLHLDRYIQTEGAHKKGTLLCIAGRTGYITGPHTHIKATKVKKNGDKLVEIDRNDADNTFNQEEFYTGEYAVDFAK